MTAEIAILNKEGIALAADSAVTMRQGKEEKIFPSALKLFALSKYAPVGIMVYGNAKFMGIPWETIIKVYREQLGSTRLNTINEYADNFINYLINCPMLPKSKQKEYVLGSIEAFFQYVLLKKIDEDVQKYFKQKSPLPVKELKKIVSNAIAFYYNFYKDKKELELFKKGMTSKFNKLYSKSIDDLINRIFKNLPVLKNDIFKLKTLARYLFFKDYFFSNCSSVVIAGFGESEIYPNLINYEIEAIIMDNLKYRIQSSVKIDDGTNAVIVPLAQREMVDIFMSGVDPKYQKNTENWLESIFNGYQEIISGSNYIKEKEKSNFKKFIQKINLKVLKDFIDNMTMIRDIEYTAPVINVVASLPKDELAIMAETLVNLTSFKRKVSMVSETVGGPIDVAVISKGDGLIWIKRKHYFKPELNHHFFKNYYEEL